MLRIELRPDPALAARLEVLDGAGHVADRGGRGRAGPDGRDPQPGAGGGWRRSSASGARAPTPARAATACSCGRLRWKPARRSSRTERCALANLLVPDGEAIGFLGWARDQDWYRLPTSGARRGERARGRRRGRRRGGARRSRCVDARSGTPVKLSETRAGRGERAVLRNVGVPAGATELFLIGDRRLRLDGGRHLRRARSERARPRPAARPSPTTTRPRPSRSPTGPCRASWPAATSTSSPTPPRLPSPWTSSWSRPSARG